MTVQPRDALGSAGDTPRTSEMMNETAEEPPTFSLPLWWHETGPNAAVPQVTATTTIPGWTPPPRQPPAPPERPLAPPLMDPDPLGLVDPEPVDPPPLRPSFTKAGDTAESPSAPPLQLAPEDDDPGFGWDFEAPDPLGGAWETGLSKGKKIAIVSAVGAAILALGVTAALYFTKEDPKPKPPPTAQSPLAASQMAPERVAEYQATGVLVASLDGHVQVTWKAPPNTEGLFGYMVAAQTPGGELLDRQLIQNNELIAVFSGPAAGENSCYVVTTLVRGTPSLQLATGHPVCPNSPAQSGSPSPGASAPGAPAAAPSEPDSLVPPEGDEQAIPADE